ncbi:calcium-binding protein [Massilia sp. W12]|uniref:calcium-binding protein n=1 Tax=Massilia sp. W12 TaxID=3126507 RepID=UPI0030D0476E
MAIISGTENDDILYGSKENDKLYGYGGNDTFRLITGGDNNGIDWYDGGSGVNMIQGGWSYDVLHVMNHLANLQNIQILDGGDGTAEYNTVQAGPDSDYLDFSQMIVKNFVLDGGAGFDVIIGTDGGDVIRGGLDNDKLYGGAGDDTFLLLTGGDKNGVDWYEGGTGHNTIKGDWSYDVLHVMDGLQNLQNIHLLDGGDGTPAYNTVLATDADETLNFSKITVKNFVLDGAGGNDVIIATEAGDVIRGGAGNDKLYAEGGDDTFLLITGGDKNGLDYYDGGAGLNRITGDWSYDVLHVENKLMNLQNIQILDGGDKTWSYNVVQAGKGDDSLDFSKYQVNYFTIDGGDGNDAIIGNDDVNHIRGGAGHDTISGAGGDDVLSGQAGDDVFQLITGGDFNGTDWYDGGSGVNSIVGGWSYDVLHVVDQLANLKNIQILDGGDGTTAYNTVLASDAHETLDFSGMLVKNFVLDGAGGNDLIIGGKGDDEIRGGAGDDKLYGGAGDDSFLLITGGDKNGLDLFVGGDGVNTIKGGWSYDVLHVMNHLENLQNIQVLDGGDGTASYNTVLGTAQDDYLDFSHMVVKNFVLDGAQGNDAIYGSKGDDVIRGGAGNDKLNGGAGDDTFLLITGGDKNGFDYYDGGAGFNVIKGDWSYDVLHVDNLLSNLVNIQMIDGGDGTAAYNSVLATPDADTLPFYSMTLRNLTIKGGAGNDIIGLSRLADQSVHYQGNEGDDRFVFETDIRVAVIDDFNQAGNDVLDLRAWQVKDLQTLQHQSFQVGADVVINVASGAQITLIGTQLAQLDWTGASDFLL